MFKSKEQAKLIEKLGVGLEELLSLSPLASRIYALLILSSYEGLTFEEIKDVIQASKSSISVNINVLIQLSFINFYTKPGDRKRYFKLAKYSQITSLEMYLQAINLEMSMIERVNKFNKTYHPEKFIEEQSIGKIFQEYLLEKQQLVDRTIIKMKNFREGEK